MEPAPSSEDVVRRLVDLAASLWGTSPDKILGRADRKPSREPNAVQARAAVCFVLDLHSGISAREIARRLGISHPTVTKAILRADTALDPRTRDLEQELLWPNPDPSENN